jgi:hypothetical protein
MDRGRLRNLRNLSNLRILNYSLERPDLAASKQGVRSDSFGVTQSSVAISGCHGRDFCLQPTRLPLLFCPANTKHR